MEGFQKNIWWPWLLMVETKMLSVKTMRHLCSNSFLLAESSAESINAALSVATDKVNSRQVDKNSRRT
jgi:hypothetical protein